jgi:hypothetical protein
VNNFAFSRASYRLIMRNVAAAKATLLLFYQKMTVVREAKGTSTLLSAHHIRDNNFLSLDILPF